MSAAEAEPGDGGIVLGSEPNAVGNVSPSAVLAIVLAAEGAVPIVTQEVTDVVLSSPEKAGRLLAAAAIDNMMRWSPEGPSAQPSGLQSLIAHTRAQRNLDSVTGSQPFAIEQKTRDRLKTQYTEEVEATREPAESFLGLVAVVDRLANSLDDQLFGADDRVGLLSGIYDRTDDIDNPALSVLPTVNSFARETPRRDALVEAERILRFILFQAVGGV